MYHCNFRCLILAPQSTASDNLGSRRNDKLKNPKIALPPPPIYVSTNRSLVNPDDLGALFSRCNLSCHRFPVRDSSTDRVQPPDPRKVRLALRHSSIVVSVFCRREGLDLASSDDSASDDTLSPRAENWGDFLFGKVMPPLPQVKLMPDGRLVGFGRAVSDHGLTASIYDVVVRTKALPCDIKVVPPLRRRGIGRLIVKRIVRMLVSQEIYDIAALCSKEERLFFEACGFSNDILGSTTMMYTSIPSTSSSRTSKDVVNCADRKILQAPPLGQYFPS